MQVISSPSPNFNGRKFPVDMLVLHYTGMESGEAALARMCDPKAEVSAHYMVWEDGRIAQLVDEAKRAWHAGVATWQAAMMCPCGTAPCRPIPMRRSRP